MKTLKIKLTKFWNKYDAHVMAIVFTTLFTTAFYLVLLEVIAQAFVDTM